MKKSAVKNVLVTYYVHNYRSLQKVEDCLKKHKIKYVAVKRRSLKASLFEKRDLIISVGGDGTFLRAAHFSLSTPILCVSSDTNINEGHFAQASREDFEKKFRMLLKGKYKIRSLMRLQPTINKKTKLPLALNEVFVGSKRPYHTSRYTIQIGKKREFQKSSGVLVSTPAGSTAWSRSAGGKKLPLDSKSYYYVVREPYFGRLTQPKLTKGVLGEKKVVKIISDIYDGIVVIDSQSKEHNLLCGDVLEIRKSKHPLKAVVF
jgi:NAD kinase